MRSRLLVYSAILLAPAIASAQSDPNMPTASATATPAGPADPLAKENWPLSGVDRPLGLSAGMLQLDVNGGVGLSKGASGEPIKMPLAVLLGLTNELQAGVFHSTGLCLTGTDKGCAKVYDDFGVQLLYSLYGRGSALELAGWTQFNYASIDAGKMNLQVGGAMNWVVAAGNIAILAYPNLGIGLSKREELANKETLGVPLQAFFRASEKIAPFIATGLGTTAIDGFGDSYIIPAGLGVLVGLSPMLDVGARFDFDNALGKNNTTDLRSATVWVSLRPL